MDTLPPVATSDHDRLIRVETMMETVYKGLLGNGQIGLLRDHESLKTEVAETRADLSRLIDEKVEAAKQENVVVVAAAKEDLKRETPGKGGQRIAISASAVAFVVAVVQGVLAAMRS